MNTDPWTRAHTPKTPADVVGQDAAVARVLSYIQTFKRGSKPLLLAGPPGSGKTSMVIAAAIALHRELIEVNASDERNKDAIASIVGQAAFQASLFGNLRVILVDELDGVSGTKDRGGIPELLDILPRSAHPIILTVNDLTLDKLKPVRKACEVLELEIPTVAQIAGLLSRIAQLEDIALDTDAAAGIARRCGGDVRAAVNDSQAIAHSKIVTKSDLDLLDARDSTASLHDALVRIFKTTSAEIALPSLDNVDEEPETLLHWIDENLPKVYRTPQDLARAYTALSDADRYFGRIRRWQHYRYYVYIYNLLTAGVALAKESKQVGAIDPKQPDRFLKLWIAKQRNAKRDALAKSLAPSMHTSAKRTRQDILPYLRAIAKAKGVPWAKQLALTQGLDEEHASWLTS